MQVQSGQIWTKVLGLTGGGALLGTLVGLALDPTMKPAPSPPWRSASAASATPYQIVDAGPSDLVSPNWYDGPVDLSVPRYQPYASAIAYVEPAPVPDPLPELETPEPAQPLELNEPALVVAGEAEAAAEDARAAEAASAPIPMTPEVRPALTEDATVL